MPIAITVRPVDAGGALLPVESTIEVSHDGHRVVGTCLPGKSIRFPALAEHRIYRIGLDVPGFQSAGEVVASAAADVTVDIRCMLRSRDCVLHDPPVAQLDPALIEILAEQALEDDPDCALRLREPPTRALPTRCPPPRQLPARGRHAFDRAAARWSALSAEQRGGLLNLYAKMRSIAMEGDCTVWSYIERVVRVEQDRIFVDVSPGLATRVRELPHVFQDADDSLHQPDVGYQNCGSVKSREGHGNLQLSFSKRTNDEQPTRVDADVDEAAGLGHAGQVLRNWLTGGKTHPYDVHQILMVHQEGTDGRRKEIGLYRPCYRVGRRDGPPDYRLPQRQLGSL